MHASCATGYCRCWLLLHTERSLPLPGRGIEHACSARAAAGADCCCTLNAPRSLAAWCSEDMSTGGD